MEMPLCFFSVVVCMCLLCGVRSTGISSANNNFGQTNEVFIKEIQQNARIIICMKHKPVLSWKAADVDHFIQNIHLGSACANSVNKYLLKRPSKSCMESGSETHDDSGNDVDSRSNACLLRDGDDSDYSIKRLLLLKGIKQFNSTCRDNDVLNYKFAMEQIYGLADFNKDGDLDIDEFSRDFNEDGDISYAEFANSTNQFFYTSLSNTCGAEDMDLNHLRKANPRVFLTFLISTLLSPHVSLYLIGSNLDIIMFGEDEAETSSPRTWYGFLFYPGITIARYYQKFLDTNFFQSAVLMAISCLCDVFFWIELALLCKYANTNKQKLFALLCFLSRNLGGLAATLVFYGVVSLTLNVDYLVILVIHGLEDYISIPWAIKKMIFLFNINYISIIFIVSYAAKLYIFVLLRFFYSMKTHSAFVGFSDPSKMNDLIKLANELQSNNEKKLISKQKLKDLYDQGGLLGTGGYGCVYSGIIKGTKEPVAIKELKVTVPIEKEEKRKFMDLVFAIQESMKSNYTFFVGKAMDVIERSNGEDAKVATFMHEVLALEVIKNLKHTQDHPSLQVICSAHMENNNFYIVSKRIVPLVSKNVFNSDIDVFKPKSTMSDSDKLIHKLHIIQTFFSAVDALHKVGIVHRDISPGNLGVSMADQDIAVLIDFGVAYIPTSGTERKVQSPGHNEYLSPDYYRDKRSENQKRHYGALDTIAFNYKGPPFDCFAAGLTAVEILTDYAYFKKFVRNVLLKNHKKELDQFVQKLISEKDKEKYQELLDKYNRCMDLKLQEEMPKWNEETTDELLNLLPKYVPGEIKELLRGLLHPYQDKRTSMNDAAKCGYFVKNKIGLYGKQLVTEDLGVFKEFLKFFTGDDNRKTNIMKEREEAWLSVKKVASTNSLAPSIDSPNFYDKAGDVVRTRTKLLREIILESKPEEFRSGLPIFSSDTFSGDLGQKLVDDLLSSFNKKIRNSNCSSNCDFEISLQDFESVFEECNLSSLMDLKPKILFEFLDVDKSNGVSRCELLTGISFLLSHKVDETTQLKLLFHAYDLDGNGKLTWTELATMISHFYTSDESLTDIDNVTSGRDSNIGGGGGGGGGGHISTTNSDKQSTSNNNNTIGSFDNSASEVDHDTPPIDDDLSPISPCGAFIKIKVLDLFYNAFAGENPGSIDIGEFINGLQNNRELASLAKMLLNNDDKARTR